MQAISCLFRSSSIIFQLQQKSGSQPNSLSTSTLTYSSYSSVAGLCVHMCECMCNNVIYMVNAFTLFANKSDTCVRCLYLSLKILIRCALRDNLLNVGEIEIFVCRRVNTMEACWHNRLCHVIWIYCSIGPRVKIVDIFQISIGRSESLGCKIIISDSSHFNACGLLQL